MTNKDGSKQKKGILEEGDIASFGDSKERPDNLESIASSGNTSTYGAQGKYQTNLSIISSSAVDKYVDAVKTAFNIPEEAKYFAAYFCKIIRSSHTDYNYKLLIDTQMETDDYLESLSKLFGESAMNDRLIKELTGKTISELTKENKAIDIDMTIFPEYHLIKWKFDSSSSSSIKESNDYVELLKMRQCARTFYAGAIDMFNAANPIHKYSSYTDSPIIRLSSKQIAEFASKNKIDDYIGYFKAIKDGC